MTTCISISMQYPDFHILYPDTQEITEITKHCKHFLFWKVLNTYMFNYLSCVKQDTILKT